MLLYLASVEVVTLGGPEHTGQTLLSVLWALAGVGALVVGLLADDRALRRGALVAARASRRPRSSSTTSPSLTSLYRVGSLIGLGLLLLCGAFAWQQVRPASAPTLERLTQPPHPPRHPTSDDEELLEAETTAILSEYTDAQRLLRIQDELRAGFRALSHVGKAVSIFGSARTPRDHPRYEAARTLARELGERATRSSPAAARGSWRPPTAARRRPGRSASGSGSSSRTSSR